MFLEQLNQWIYLVSSSAGDKLDEILPHHIGDSANWIPIEIFGFDLSITKHVVIMWIVAALLILMVTSVAKAITKDESAVSSRLSVLVEVFLKFIYDDIIKPNFHGGTEGKRFLPFFCTMFFFIMFCNLFGLIPGSATVTGNISVTMTLAIVTFLFTQFYGMKKHGFGKYWASIVPSGVPGMLWPFMFFIEFVGQFTKPFALTIRLFANMIAGHIVIIVLLFLTAKAAGSWTQLGIAPLTVGASVAVNLLEIFIALLQAYIFTFLSAIFISEAGEGH